MEPERRLPVHTLRNTVALWGGLLLLICAAWAFERHTQGRTAWQILSDVPWTWVALGTAIVGGFAWLVTRRPSLSPEIEQVLAQVARERAACRYCGHPRQAQALTCKSCGRVVDWGQLVTAGLFVLMLLALITLRSVL